VASGGQYNHQIGKRAQISLIRVFLDNASVYPEISGGRHMIAIRFLERNSNGQFNQTEENIEFKLSLC
jgi:cell division FtsZ-interacting protein ZapD